MHSLDVMGHKIGVVTSENVILSATNTDGGDIDDSSLSVTVSLPDMPDPVEMMLINKIIDDIKENSGGYVGFELIKTKRANPTNQEIFDESNKPMLHAQLINGEPVKYQATSRRQRFEPLIFNLNVDVDDKFISTDYNRKLGLLRQAFTTYIQSNPDLEYGNNLYYVEDIRVTNVSYEPFTITVEATIELENL